MVTLTRKRSATNEVRTGHKPQDREGARASSSRQAARYRRRGDRVKRRECITLLGGAAAAWPLAARAQQRERMRRIGVLMLGDASDPDQQRRVGAFRAELARMGWIEGQNIEIQSQFAATASDRIRAKATDFVAQNLDAILANGTPVLEALQQRTSTVPIVFVGVSDPLNAGFVPSRARPGATSRALAISSTRSAENGWSFSTKPLRTSGGWECSCIETIRHGPAI
jgi:hypothetical protein